MKLCDDHMAARYVLVARFLRFLALGVLLAVYVGVILFAPASGRAQPAEIQPMPPSEYTAQAPEYAAQGDGPWPAVGAGAGAVPATPAPRRLTYDEAALALVLARVAFNEALDSEADLLLIWQVVRGHARTPQGRLAWLRRHSRCVTGTLPAAAAARRPGNCRWARGLHADGSEPAGWDRARDGDWRRLRRRWLEHQARAFEAVRAGDDAATVCAETPTTWDGRVWAHRWAARGLVEVACEGTRNAGLVPARRRRRGR